MTGRQRRFFLAVCALLWLFAGALTDAEAEALPDPSESGNGWMYSAGTLTITENDGAADYAAAARSHEELARLVICDNVTELGAADGWIRANQITVAHKNSVYWVCNGILLQRADVGIRCVFAQWPLKTAVVPYGVTEIGDDAFLNQTELRALLLPDSVVKIGFGAFENCSALREVTLPASVCEVSGFAFWNCAALQSADLSRTSITRLIDAFGFCTNLREVLLPETLEEVCDGAFHACGSLEKLKLPHSVKKIQSGALLGCMGLRVFNIPSGAQIVLPSEAEPFDSFPSLFGKTGVRTVVFEGEAAQVPAGTFHAYEEGEERIDAAVERLIFTGKPPRGDWRAALAGLPKPPELYYSDVYARQWKASRFAERSGMRATAITAAEMERILDGMDAGETRLNGQYTGEE